MADLYPKLCIMFEAPWLAVEFAEQCKVIDGLEIEIVSAVIVEIKGADHPMLRNDLAYAAKIVGGEEVPENRNG